MKWSRAKTILIVSFFVLNILLAYQLWADEWSVLSFGQSEEARATERLLKEKNISLASDIPSVRPFVKEIYVKYQKNDSFEVRHALSPPVELNLLNFQVVSVNWMENLAPHIPEIHNYAIDPVQSRPNVIVLNQVVQGLPLFETNLLLFVENGFITHYSQNFVRVSASGNSGEELAALSPYQFLPLLAEKYLSPGVIITEIRLGYHGQMFNDITQLLVPKWRVAIANGDIYYVNAINGEVEGPY